MFELKGKRIFVAGATGLAGSAIIKALSNDCGRPQIVGAHRHSDGAFIDHPSVHYVEADLTRLEDCIRACGNCDLAVLAAANTGGAQASASSPWTQVTPNIVMDAYLLQALHETGIRRAVYVSTASAYQPFDGKIKEDEMRWDIDPHDNHLGVGWVKRYGEKACAFWAKKTGLEVVILRLSNIFGPYASFDPQKSNFIPAIIRKAVDRMDPFEVWGSLDVTRDVLYVEDLATAVVTALKRSEIAYDVFNIGSGVKTTVGDVLGWALAAAGHIPTEIKSGKSDPSALTYRALDVSKANSELGWTANYSIEQGIALTVDWWIRNRDKWTR